MIAQFRKAIAAFFGGGVPTALSTLALYWFGWIPVEPTTAQAAIVGLIGGLIAAVTVGLAPANEPVADVLHAQGVASRTARAAIRSAAARLGSILLALVLLAGAGAGLAACSGRAGQQLEPPDLTCVATDLYCQWTAAQAAYAVANKGVVAASKAGAISLATLERAKGISDAVAEALAVVKAIVDGRAAGDAAAELAKAQQGIAELERIAPHTNG